jgi:hypothetical protein
MRAARHDLRTGQRRGGLISVEAAAVIFVIALFVAFLIIALSGYIGKAQDKGYANEARNYAIAAKATLGERFARGEDMPPRDLASPATEARYIIVGLSSQALASEMAALMDVPLSEAADEPGYWVLYLAGPPSTSALQCDGFLYLYYPQGAGAEGNPSSAAPAAPADGATSEDYILVTYKMTPYPDDLPEAITPQTLLRAITYDAEAGFYAYHGPAFSG